MHPFSIGAKRTFYFVGPNANNYDSILDFVCLAFRRQSATPAVACGCCYRGQPASPGPAPLYSAQSIIYSAAGSCPVSHESPLASIIEPNQVEALPVEFGLGLKKIEVGQVGPDIYQSSQDSIYH